MVSIIKLTNFRVMLFLAFLVIILIVLACYKCLNVSIHSDEVRISYENTENVIIQEVKDKNDILEIKKILSKVKHWDNPSCGFKDNNYICFGDLYFYPACDGCPRLQVGDSNWYINISDKEKARLHKILKKYGMIFPCL